jgi:lipopolysaccharide transport system ATP-binding protein
MPEALITVDGLSKKFCRSLKHSLWYGVQDLASELRGRRHGRDGELRANEFWALQDISFELKRGECIGLIGRNGAGKSTLLKLLNGLIKPDQGRITMHGRVGALIELNAGFAPILTGRENIDINGQILGFSKQEIDAKLDAILAFADIDEFIDMPVQNYSSGMKVRLGFAIAAQMEPDVLIIDEVLAVGDIGFRVKCLNRIQELLETSAVIFVSHSMPLVARICNQVMVLNQGRSLLHSPDVGEGIDLYYSAFDAAEKRLHGSGEVEITAIICNGRPPETTATVPFGGALKIEVTLNVKTRCRLLGMRMVVWNQDQRPVMDVVNEEFNTYTWENAGGVVVVAATLPAMRLAAGKHSVVITIIDPANTRTLCRLDNAVAFVMGHHLSTASESFVAAKYEHHVVETDVVQKEAVSA